ncbi:MAG: class I SAM-dependent methyltransferase [Bacteroidia bacterium]|nr:class I SAM-dependent methyltransferase [Bacteroidia bacterium]
MDKFKQLARIKDIYNKGGNIIKYLKGNEAGTQNSLEDILISYDFQSGSYIKHFASEIDFKTGYGAALASVIGDLGNFNSIMEAGVGEATTLGSLLPQMKQKPSDVFGFDISWSRLKFARSFLADMDITNASLFTANLFEIPLSESSIDVVYTSHSIEPNGGREKEALQELYRVTGKYLILLEPSFEFGSPEAQARMKEHGYVTRLYEAATELGYKVIEHRLFGHSANPLNPTGLIIIEKTGEISTPPALKCPISLTDLEKHNDSLLYSKDSFLAYPVINDIPCLLKENSILAVHLLSDYAQFKAANNIMF